MAREKGHSRAPELAKQFSRVFVDYDEAWWGLEVIRRTLDRLGVRGPDDGRFSISFPGPGPLRLNYGGWLVLEFGATAKSGRWAWLVSPKGALPHLAEHAGWVFATRPGEMEISGYNLPLSVVRDDNAEIWPFFWQAVEHVARRFAHWRRTNYRRAHNAALAKAVFDPDLRSELLSHGIPPPQPGWFSTAAFDLLKTLSADPTKGRYDAIKGKLEAEVSQPLRGLLAAVASRLPDYMAETMETERDLISRIAKNDYGRGGVWGFQWGAFYWKGESRTSGAQLFVSVRSDGLTYGFSIGERSSGTARRRFDRSILANRGELKALLDGYSFVFGKSEQPAAGFDAWLTEQPMSPRVTLSVQADEVLAAPSDALCEEIAATFRSLYPLVLLASLDDAMPAVRQYAGSLQQTKPLAPEYTLAQCADDTGIGVAELQRWIGALDRKGQAVLYGPPGTGKTFVARHLAEHLVGGTDGFCELVQFHPAYAYEDFMLGIRPRTGPGGGLEYPVAPGRFLEFCAKAGQRTGPCVLIIDEINRANLARVFGELMYLMEYREECVPLSVDGRLFSIPANARLIGTMNTADRSIALVDHALRRRFAFIRLSPNYRLLEDWHVRHETGFPADRLAGVLHRLNTGIGDPNYEVGISFFLREKLLEEMEDVWRMDIEPYLEEVFFDQRSTMEEFRWEKVRRHLVE